jgi:hypothetical protein
LRPEFTLYGNYLQEVLIVDVAETIELAAKVFGNQKALAAAIGE